MQNPTTLASTITAEMKRQAIIDEILAADPEFKPGKAKKDELAEVLAAIRLAAEVDANAADRGPAWVDDGEGLSAKEVAIELNTDARTIRKFFRETELVGRADRGNRYAIDAKAIKPLRKAFATWLKARQDAAEAKAAAKAAEATDEG